MGIKRVWILGLLIVFLVAQAPLARKAQAAEGFIAGPALTIGSTPIVMDLAVTLLSSVSLGVDYPKATGAALLLGVTVSASALGVSVGPVADYTFTDSTVNSTFIGYNYAIGVRSSNMSPGDVVNISRGLGVELPAGTTFDSTQAVASTADAQSDLTAVTGTASVLSSLAPNGAHCGATYAGTLLDCTGATIHPEFDRVQWAKLPSTALPASVATSSTTITATVN